jgi:hypothetical protein
MINFPNSPSVGAVYTAGGYSWRWDGTHWISVTPSPPATVNPNKLMNQFMEIDQQNEGASQAPINGWAADGWRGGGASTGTITWQRVSNGPPGMPFSISMTVTTAASSLGATDSCQLWQSIEAAELYDTQFGLSTAQPLTFSFWAYCTLAGTYVATLHNDTQNRAYLFSFTLAASTWTLITQVIPGDTAGTWVTSGNAAGAYLMVIVAAGSGCIGVAGWQSASAKTLSGASTSFPTTINARFQLGPCKLELGSVATPMIRQPFQQELARCQRYYEKSYDVGTAIATNTNNSISLLYLGLSSATATQPGTSVWYAVPKRAVPTLTMYSSVTGTAGRVRDAQNGVDVALAATLAGNRAFYWIATLSAASNVVNMQAHWVADARL